MEVYYKPSDIVWVKLGPFWWPGEVVDKTSVPEDLIETLKKEPVAIVKFFDEDGYFEFVKTPEGIFPYNCERKLDFIKKGMDAFRAKNPKMSTFPKDVSAAEVKTGGNANILSDPIFTTERKRNYAAEIFGSPAVKKPRESHKSQSSKSEPIITHRRFLGYDDYEARVLIPASEDTHDEDEDTPPAVTREETFNKFTCPVCQFSTGRLGILLKHTSCHVKEISFVSRQPMKKPQKRKKRKALSDDDLSGEEKKTKAKRKYTKKKVNESLLADDERSENEISFSAKDSTLRKYGKKPAQPVTEEKKDICNDIIADWDDGSDHEGSSEKDTTLDSTLNFTQQTSDEAANSSIDNSSLALHLTGEDLDSTGIAKETEPEIEASETEKPGADNTEKSQNISCFDFDEDEEETKIPDATSGRKIPRVIPISERRKTFELEDEDEEEEKKKKKILEESEELAKLTETSTETEKESESLEKTYQSLMDSTENLDIPDIPNILKNEQNFHSARTVKYPDKTRGDSLDLIEAENEEKKKENSEKNGTDQSSNPEEQSNKLDAEEESKAVEEEKIEEKSQSVEEKITVDVEVDQTSKVKTKKTTKSKRGRKSSRSKHEITESNIDALLLKQEVESKRAEEEKQSEPIQVPLNTLPVTAEETVTEEPLTLIQPPEEESNFPNNNEVASTKICQDLNKESEEEFAPTLNKEEHVSTEENIDKQKGNETSKTMETSEEVTVVETATVDEQSSLSEKIESKLSQLENEKEDVEGEPEPKKRKTTRGSSRSSKPKEDMKPKEELSQSHRRGRSKDVEASIVDESKSPSEKTNQRELKKSRPTRKSTRWDSASSKTDDEMPKNDSSIEETTLSQDEINNVIFGPIEIKEDIAIHTEDPTLEPESPKESSKNATEAPENEEDKKDSAPIITPEQIPVIVQHDESLEKDNCQSAEEQETEESKPDKNDLKRESSPPKIEKAKDNKSHRSSRNEKRSRNDKDNKRDESSKSEDSSSHRSSRSSRRSSRHEKGKQDSSERGKTVQPDEPHLKHPKDGSSPKKSGSSKDAHNSDLEIPSGFDKEENVPRRSNRKDKKAESDSRRHKNSPVEDERKEHVSYSRSSKRQSRSSKSSQDSLKPLEDGDTSISTSKKQGESSLLKEETKEKPQSSYEKLGKLFKQDEANPFRDLFSPSETVVSKTKEQKREELKSIFSFDYDEKKRRTYGHKRKSKVNNQEKITGLEASQDIKKDEISPESNVKTTENENKNEENKTEQDNQPCSEEIKTVDEQLIVPPPELPDSQEESSEKPKESIDIQKEEVIDVGKEEIAVILEPKEAAPVPDADTTELIVHQDQSELHTVTIENQNEKLTEVPNNDTEKESKTVNNSSEDKKFSDHDTVLEKDDKSSNKTVENEKEPIARLPTKKRRKPSRWDQKEKTNLDSNQEQKKTEENKEEIQLQNQGSEPTISAITSQIPLGIDDTSQKEMEDIFSQKESSELAEKNAAQIELIFGSSPLPGLNENDNFIEDNSALESTSEQKEISNLAENMNDSALSCGSSSQNPLFEQASDTLESVESQVARITHYEEPAVEQKVPQDKKSIFDTPEKNEKLPSLNSPEKDIDVVTNVSNEESSNASIPKTKKTYLLKEKERAKEEKAKMEKDENAKLEIEEKAKTEKESTNIQEAPAKSVDKANEVATRLTNPKKRFVKSFEDFELNKQREKSLEADKSSIPEPKPGTSLITGKSPIAFKLKKQMLSKICSIFDDDDEKKESKPLKLKLLKQDSPIKKKEVAKPEKTETTTKSCAAEVTETKTEKTSEVVCVSEGDIKSSEKSAEISNVDNTILKCEIPSLDSGNSNQEMIKSDVPEIEDFKTDDSTLKVHQAPEESTELSTDSVHSDLGKFEPSKPNLEVQEASAAIEPTDKNEDRIDIPETEIVTTNFPIVEDVIAASATTVPTDKPEDLIDISKTEIITTNFPLDEDKKEETEYVSIDGNLTVVSEQELAEGQVEITASMPSKKPMTISSFSMDFSDESSDASFEAFKKEKLQVIAESLGSKNVEDENKVIDGIEKEMIVVPNEKSKTLDNTEQIIDEAEIEVLDNKEKQTIDDATKDKTAIEKIEVEQIIPNQESAITINEPKNLTDTVEKEQIVDSKKELSEVDLNVTKEFEIEYTPSTYTAEHKEEKTEAKKEKLAILEPVLTEEIQMEKIQQAESALLSIFSGVKNTTKSSEAGTLRTKEKDSSRRKLNKTEEIPVANEPLVIYNTAKSSTVTEMCDLEDHIPSQIVCTKINEEVMKVAGMNNELTKEGAVSKKEPEMSKLLCRLTTDKKEDPISKIKATEVEAKLDAPASKLDPTKNLLKAVIKSKNINTSKSASKAIILSEKIIRPAREVSTIATKRTYEDVEDIEPYIIAKVPKQEPKKEETVGAQKLPASSTSKVPANSSRQFIINANKQIVGVKKSSGKAKILNQTIIRPAGEKIPTKKVATVIEDNVDFDINSMPIVLSDELLTAETLENMPIVLGDQAQKAVPASENMKIIIERKPQSNSKMVTKPAPMTSASASSSPPIRTPVMKRTTPKILQTPKPGQKIIRQVTPGVSSKAGKFVVVSDSPNRPSQIMKKQPNLLKKTVPVTSVASSTPSIPTESTGHKIMIFTNQQGKQQRLLLTPAQQKLFGMQVAGKTVVKSATAAQKSQLAKVQTSTLASTSKLPGQSIQSPKLVKTSVGAAQVASPQMKIVPPRKNQKTYIAGSQSTKLPQQKTILITNQHGQTVRKIQGTNEALLDKQVAEQLEAIKVSSMKAQQKQQEANARANVVSKHSAPTRKTMIKRPEPKQTAVAQTKPSHSSTSTISGPSRLMDSKIPPLSPLKPDKKTIDSQKQSAQGKAVQNKPDRPLHQLVIQDNVGNQTTITEGQILALPSETVDGQPQSYMLVTLDETGNLTPLNNEALMSLDPSLAGLAGGDLSNMVLQMDTGTSKDNVNQTAQLHVAPITTAVQEKPKPVAQQQVVPPKQIVQPVEQPAAQVQVTCNINGEPGQQIILTGDPAATQKFLDSLSDGSTDLANILAGAEGNSFLIQADGQQILINTEPTEAPILQQPEQGNPMFSTHPVKNQDILAAALADTDVFQQDQVSGQGKITHSQLSPGQTLYPMSVGNVLETSLTLNSPIMTPLEVPSTNSKRIPDEEAGILTTHVPKNVDLPITITDPNISQTVSHQQVLMASDLQSNLELSLPISETNMSVTSDINSPSFVYSLPSLDVSEHTEISHKTFSSSMPLLTEDIDESHAFVSMPSKSEVQGSAKPTRTETSVVTSKKLTTQRELKSNLGRRMVSGGTFLEEGLCSLGAEMCSSLSEPPPEMFDLPMENDGMNFLNKSDSSKEKSTSASSDLLSDDNSLENSVQSHIVSDFKDSSQSCDSSSSVSQDKTL